MVTISAPTKAKITVATPENIARARWGRTRPRRRGSRARETAPGNNPITNSAAEHDKDDDSHDLYAGEPELELAVGADGVEVGGGEQQDQDQGYEPRAVSGMYCP